MIKVALVWVILLAVFSVLLLTHSVDVSGSIPAPWGVVILIGWLFFAVWFIRSNR